MNSNIYLVSQGPEFRYLQTDNPSALTKLILDGWRVHSPSVRAHACTIDPRTNMPYWTYENLEIVK